MAVSILFLIPAFGQFRSGLVPESELSTIDYSTGRLKPPKTTYAALPAAASSTDLVYLVTDGNADCTAGSGTKMCWFRSNGSAWVTVGDGVGGGAANGNTLLYTTVSNTQTLTGSPLTFASYTIPANTLSAGDCVVAQINFIHGTGSASITYTFNFGAYSFSHPATTNAGAAYARYLVCYASGNTSTVTGMQTSGTFGSTTVSMAAETTATVDATNPISVSWTANGPGTDAVSLRMFTLEALR
jgi:hypothetical protein